MNSTEGAGGPVSEQLERDHELRAALCGIEAVAVVLNRQRDRLTAGHVDQLALAIASEARRLRSLLDPQPQQRSSFDLAEAIGPAILAARSSGVEVRAALNGELNVYGRHDAAAQVVLTLLDNARQHAASSAVDIRATVRGRTTLLYIEDRGVGITSTLGRHVFERGVRGADSSGSGLGLFIARRLMVEQGGTLAVHPRPGGGTSFVLRFRSSLPCSSPRRRSSLVQLAGVA